MIQKDDFSPYSILIRQNQAPINKTAVIATITTNDINDNNNNNAIWNKRNHAVYSLPSGVDNAPVWKRQRCSYNGEMALKGVMKQDTATSIMDQDDMMGNAKAANNNANANVKRNNEPSDGICFMMAPNSSNCDSMAIDDVLDVINAEDYYEDKWD